MPYTRHGHWYGLGDPTKPGPELVTKCGGPRLCPKCSVEAVGSPARPASTGTFSSPLMPVFRAPEE